LTPSVERRGGRESRFRRKRWRRGRPWWSRSQSLGPAVRSKAISIAQTHGKTQLSFRSGRHAADPRAEAKDDAAHPDAAAAVACAPLATCQRRL